jgi:predicted 3-demethylubiquinone-9 3-methyltransferase (glyoxalase superfamily)
MPDVTTFLAFDSQAEQAVELYVSLFDNARIRKTMRGEGGAVFSLTFEILGQTFHAMNGGPGFSFASGISLFVACDTQAQIDRYWTTLVEGGKEVGCGWLVDRFGVSWQIVPRALESLLGDADRAKAGRAMQAMMTMKKLDIAALQSAHAG